MADPARNGHESATFTAALRWPVHRARNRDPPAAQRKRHPGLPPGCRPRQRPERPSLTARSLRARYL